jgi:hypothetical protein
MVQIYLHFPTCLHSFLILTTGYMCVFRMINKERTHSLTGAHTLKVGHKSTVYNFEYKEEEDNKSEFISLRSLF